MPDVHDGDRHDGHGQRAQSTQEEQAPARKGGNESGHALHLNSDYSSLPSLTIRQKALALAQNELPTKLRD